MHLIAQITIPDSLVEGMGDTPESVARHLKALLRRSIREEIEFDLFVVESVS